MAIFMQRNTFISYCPTRMLGGPGAYASSPRKNVVQFGAFFYIHVGTRLLWGTYSAR